MSNAAMQAIEDTLASLTPGDRRLLVSLPYRAGLYVSFSDISGGWEAQEAEVQSLTNILREYSEDYCQNELAQIVLMETLHERARWPAWSNKIETVPRQAQQVIRFLEPLFTEKQLNGFKEILVEIAVSVAMAFRERPQDDGEAVEHPSAYVAFCDAVIRLLKIEIKPDPFAHMNISQHERAALTNLCQGLDYNKL